MDLGVTLALYQLQRFGWLDFAGALEAIRRQPLMMRYLACTNTPVQIGKQVVTLSSKVTHYHKLLTVMNKVCVGSTLS